MKDLAGTGKILVGRRSTDVHEVPCAGSTRVTGAKHSATEKGKHSGIRAIAIQSCK